MKTQHNIFKYFVFILLGTLALLPIKSYAVQEPTTWSATHLEQVLSKNYFPSASQSKAKVGLSGQSALQKKRPTKKKKSYYKRGGVYVSKRQQGTKQLKEGRVIKKIVKAGPLKPSEKTPPPVKPSALAYQKNRQHSRVSALSNTPAPSQQDSTREKIIYLPHQPPSSESTLALRKAEKQRYQQAIQSGRGGGRSNRVSDPNLSAISDGVPLD